ncbi:MULTISPECIES: hypothetical protein [unclassified Streptomyces]|uniref:hypothetical protein n=1 Tax=unclassified Streptomyces TaxID=2593676 RepID=UPI0033BA0EB0
MKDPEIQSRFDGRGRAEFLIGGFEGSQSNKITADLYDEQRIGQVGPPPPPPDPSDRRPVTGSGQ